MRKKKRGKTSNGLNIESKEVLSHHQRSIPKDGTCVMYNSGISSQPFGVLFKNHDKLIEIRVCADRLVASSFCSDVRLVFLLWRLFFSQMSYGDTSPHLLYVCQFMICNRDNLIFSFTRNWRGVASCCRCSSYPTAVQEAQRRRPTRTLNLWGWGFTEAVCLLEHQRHLGMQTHLSY